MYGDWQLGHMPLAEYVKKHNQLADAMRSVDPAIKLVGVGDTGPWSEAMLAQCADHMNLLSEHFYCKDKPDVAEHVDLIPHNVRWKAESHRKSANEIPALKGKDIRIALDEWNYWYGPDLYGEIGVQYHLKDALGIAAGLHEMFRFSDTFYMANYAQTVNVIGCIKTSKTAACFDTTGLALALYRRHFGVHPVAVNGAPKPLDVAAAWTADRKALTIGIVNPTAESVTPPIRVTGAQLAKQGRVWRITGADPLSINVPGQKPQVSMAEETANDFRVPRLQCVPIRVRDRVDRELVASRIHDTMRVPRVFLRLSEALPKGSHQKRTGQNPGLGLALRRGVLRWCLVPNRGYCHVQDRVESQRTVVFQLQLRLGVPVPVQCASHTRVLRSHHFDAHRLGTFRRCAIGQSVLGGRLQMARTHPRRQWNRASYRRCQG